MEKSLIKKLLICGIIFVLFGVNYGAGAGTNTDYKNNVSNTNESTSSSSFTTDWWAMFRHDSGNTAYSLSDAPEDWVEYWNYQTSDFIVGSPVIVDGKVYIGTPGYYKKLDQPPGTSGTLQPLDVGGRLLCIDAEDGSLIWEHLFGFIISSPAVESGKVYVSYIVPEDEVGRIACLNAETGNLLWEKNIQYYITSPIIATGKVYIASSGTYAPIGTITCYNASTGNQLWAYTPSLNDYISCSPAILNGKLYCVHDSLTGIYVSCLNAATGQLTWDERITTDISIQSFSIAATSNTVVVAGAPYQGTYGMVYGLDGTTGETLWDYQTGEWYTQWPDIMPSLAIAYDRVYFIAMLLTQDSVVYCLDLSTGYGLWTRNLGDLAISSPAIADEKMYFSTVGGLLYCLDTTDGGFIWSTSFKGGSSSPSIANQTIFIADISGTIFAYGAPREPAIPTIQGPAEGKIKKMYNYTFSTTDPQGENIYYYVDWGDGQSENWVGPYESGDQVVIGHAWSKKGTFSIQAKAKDVYGFESGWGTLEVTMPKGTTYIPSPFSELIERLMERFPHAFPILRHLLEWESMKL